MEKGETKRGLQLFGAPIAKQNSWWSGQRKIEDKSWPIVDNTLAATQPGWLEVVVGTCRKLVLGAAWL